MAIKWAFTWWLLISWAMGISCQTAHNHNSIDGKKIVAIAKSHLGKPYLRNSLDKNEIEQLVVRFDGFDCNTFVETVLAQVKDSANVPDQIQHMRYRQGIIDGFASRIHYFSEWITENVNRGFVEDITPLLPHALPFKVKVNFMSTHRQAYPMINSEEVLQQIVVMEKNISGKTMHYIPKKYVKTISENIQNGDIIAITTNKKGLDISHLGFAMQLNGKLYLLHASSEYNKIMVTKTPLYHYLMQHQSQTGIIVLRMS